MAKKKFEIIVPGGEHRVLLHTCCAPCSSAIVEKLVQTGVNPVIFYCNPNIFPKEEYEIRKNECTRYALSLGLTIIEDDYSHDDWLHCVAGLENEPERGRRCIECFKYRLKRTADCAQRQGIKVITTTLASSRWKSLDQINAAGAIAAENHHGVTWWDQNWRKGGLSERRLEIIKEYGFYNQQYCGCEFSIRKDK